MVVLLIKGTELSELADEVSLVVRQGDFVSELRDAFVPDEIDNVELLDNSGVSEVSLLLFLLALSRTFPSVSAGRTAEGSSKSVEVPILVRLPLL